MMDMLLDLLPLTLSAITVGSFGILFALMFVKHLKSWAAERIQQQNKIIRTKRSELNQNKWYRVNLLSESRFYTIWKLNWEATGILVIKNSRATFYCNLWQGENLELDFELHKSSVDWVGRNWLHNGAASWLAITNQAGKFYFTAETGPFIVSSQKKTREIYTQLRQHMNTANSQLSVEKVKTGYV